MSTSHFPEQAALPLSDSSDGILSSLSPVRTTTPKSSALSNRITTVLSASFADLEIRDALETLDARGLQNNAETRRNLRQDAQKELIDCNGGIVGDFGVVAEQLKRIGATVKSLQRSHAEIRAHIIASAEEAKPMLEEISTSTSQRSQIEIKQQLLNAFNAHFLLPESDLTTLTSNLEPISDHFFYVMARMKRIHHDSQVLLGSENQRLGLEILEQSSKQLNAAYQKLYRWIQRDFKTLDLENPQLSAAIRRSLRVLAERPTLFQNCLDFLAEAREHMLSNAFYGALTGASSNSGRAMSTKAIELSAHDPLRYVGDMLAWAHSATVSEREALEVLFVSDGDEMAANIRAGIESEPWNRDDEAIFDGKKALNHLIDRGLSGVVRQLRQRIGQVVHSHEDPALAYKISNLITFYISIFSSLLGPQSAVLDTLQSMSEYALRQFRNTMRDHVASLNTDFSRAPSELSMPDFLTDALETLKVLMKSYDTSISPTASTQRREEGFTPILDEALEPFLAGCGNLVKGLHQPRKAIFWLNCLLGTKAVLRDYSFTAGKIAQLDETARENMEDIVSYMHTWFLSESGLQPLLATMLQLLDGLSTNISADIRSAGIFQLDSLSAIAHRLDAFLPGAMEDARSVLSKLEDTALIRSLYEKAADMFCEEFERIEEVISRLDEECRSGERDEEVMSVREAFPRTSHEVRVLLS
ncbi:Golgi transport complex subunit 6 [Elasticomyces elasticus]|nr:Golgi transport complex subunit 6 [Elasticomyces elasticus]